MGYPLLLVFLSFSLGVGITWFYRFSPFFLLVILIFLVILSFKCSYFLIFTFCILGILYSELRFPSVDFPKAEVEGVFEVKGNLAHLSREEKFFLSKYLKDGIYKIKGCLAFVPSEKRGYLWSRGYYRMIEVESFNLVSLREDPFLKRLKELYPEDVASFIYGALFGDKRGMLPSIKEVVYRSGLGHLLAVSGLHVGLLAGLTLLSLKALGIHPRLGLILSSVLLTAYTYMIGFQPSALRAYILFLLMVLGKLLGLRTSSLNLVGAAGLLLEFWNPFVLWDVGFELSFAVFLSIALAIELRLSPIFLYIAPQIATFPLLAIHFNYIPLASFLSNLIAIPIFSLALPFAFLSFVPILGEFIAPLVKLMIEIIFFISMLSIKLLPSLKL